MTTDTSQLTESLKELSNTLFLINGIQKELSTERDLIVTTTSQMASTAKQFQGYLAKFEEGSAITQKRVEDTLHKEALQAAKVMANETARLFNENSSGQVTAILKKMQEASDHAEKQLSRYAKKTKWCFALILVCTLVGGALGGWVTHALMPKMDAKLLERLDLGVVLHKVWPNLDQKDRDKIMNLFKTTTLPQKN